MYVVVIVILIVYILSLSVASLFEQVIGGLIDEELFRATSRQ